MITQKLEQKLIQKLSPQQIQLMKLLQIPAIALEQRIKQEIENNPALEEATEDDENNNDYADDVDIEDNNDENNSEDNNSEENSFEEIDIDDYYGDDDEIPDYKLASNNRSDDDNRQITFVAGTSFHDYLLSQLGLRLLDEKQKLIGEVVIGNIDDSGYLQRDAASIADDIVFSYGLNVTAGEVQEVINIIKQFDPPGVAAKDLQECLLIQLENLEKVDKAIELAKKIISQWFEDFINKHYDKILKKANVTEKELQDAINEILKLNPKPGNSMIDISKNNFTIVPDFIVINNDGKLELTINSRNSPVLRINRNFEEMLNTYNSSDKKNKETVNFIKQKIEAAKWFIDAIKQREKTLYVTMKAIIDFQKDYFLTGDETLIKPMILKDIAEIVNMDISTISRVANSKYVQTPFGTFLLKKLFSESLQTDSGEEVSTREVKKILLDCINNENKRQPYTDEQLAKLLKEKGYNIARRTVAKYREMLNIPVARLRKTL